MHQLADILIPGPTLPRSDRPVRPLGHLSFWTQPRSTGYRGLCQSDHVTLDFETTRLGETDADTPTRVSGISASPHFHFDGTPASPGSDYMEDDEETARHHARCRQLTPRTPHFFSADESGHALEGVRVFKSFLDQFAAASLPADIECVQKGVTCLGELRTVILPDLRSIEHCDANREQPGSVCRRFRAKRLQIDIHSSPYGARPEKINEVKVAECIILAHAPID